MNSHFCNPTSSKKTECLCEHFDLENVRPLTFEAVLVDGDYLDWVIARLAEDNSEDDSEGSLESSEEEAWANVMEELLGAKRQNLSIEQMEQLRFTTDNLQETAKENKRETEISLESPSPKKKTKF